MDRLRAHYPWLSGGLDYFTARLTQSSGGLRLRLGLGRETRARSHRTGFGHAALRAKCDILWAQLDALYFLMSIPGWPPPGAFQPAKES